MNTQQIATHLADLCRQGKFEDALTELFAKDAVSIEQQASPVFEKETKGLPAIIEKGKKWFSMVEQVHSVSVSAPLVGGNAFALTMALDVTMKNQGRMKMEEVCVYVVKDGKIASEQFFM